jgi:hypothetical protein
MSDPKERRTLLRELTRDAVEAGTYGEPFTADQSQPDQTPATQDADLTTEQPVPLRAWCIIAVIFAVVVVAQAVGAFPVAP